MLRTAATTPSPSLASVRATARSLRWKMHRRGERLQACLPSIQPEPIYLSLTKTLARSPSFASTRRPGGSLRPEIRSMCPIRFALRLFPRTDLDVLKRKERLAAAMIGELSHVGRGDTRRVDPNECF